MVLNIADLAPQAREHYLALGQRYGSASVLAQADKALHGLSLYAAALLLSGFGSEDALLLATSRDALADQCVRREQAAIARQVGARNHVEACQRGRRERQTARTMLRIALARLIALGAEDAARLVQAALQQTKRLSRVKALPEHLHILLTTMRHPDVASIIEGRGGPQAVQRIEQVQTDLRASMAERASTSPVTAEAEQRSLLAGLIVSLVRSANDAARLAARTHGTPSIAAAFKLTHLAPWRSRGRREPAPEAPDSTPGSSHPTTP